LKPVVNRIAEVRVSRVTGIRVSRAFDREEHEEE